MHRFFSLKTSKWASTFLFSQFWSICLTVVIQFENIRAIFKPVFQLASHSFPQRTPTIYKRKLVKSKENDVLYKPAFFYGNLSFRSWLSLTWLTMKTILKVDCLHSRITPELLFKASKHNAKLADIYVYVHNEEERNSLIIIIKVISSKDWFS